MDVKRIDGARAPEPPGRTPQQQRAAAEAPFSAVLRTEAAAAKAAPAAREGKDRSGLTAEEVFARALADRSDPDLDSLDDYLEQLIENEAGGFSSGR